MWVCIKNEKENIAVSLFLFLHRCVFLLFRKTVNNKNENLLLILSHKQIASVCFQD